jgi:hypothetical protein
VVEHPEPAELGERGRRLLARGLLGHQVDGALQVLRGQAGGAAAVPLRLAQQALRARGPGLVPQGEQLLGRLLDLRRSALGVERVRVVEEGQAGGEQGRVQGSDVVLAAGGLRGGAEAAVLSRLYRRFRGTSASTIAV